MVAGCMVAQPGESKAGLLSGPVCDQYVTSILDGDLAKVGLIRIENDDTQLIYEIEGSDGWHVSRFDLYAGTGPIPASPSTYTVHASYAPPVFNTGTFWEPLSSFGAACGDALNFAVYAEFVYLADDGTVLATQSGTVMSDDRHAPYNVCCASEDLGCTLTQGFWKTHPEAWPVASMDIGGRTYSQAELLTVLWWPVRGDASVNLAHQYIAARLNAAAGASTSDSVSGALTSADAWFAANADADGALPYGVASASANGATGGWLAWSLTSFNEGSTGTPHCDDGPATAE
jgi:hypothetical protein